MQIRLFCEETKIKVILFLFRKLDSRLVFRNNLIYSIPVLNTVSTLNYSQVIYLARKLIFI